LPQSLTTPIPQVQSQATKAIEDIFAGALAWPLWGHFGWNDIRQHYRRSTIGPLWITISMGIMIGSLGFLYSYLFHQDIADYLPFLAAGFILWNLIASLINEGCLNFINASSIIKQARVPLSVHVFRMVWKNIIIFFHNILVLILVMIWFGYWPGWEVVLALPGLLLIILNGLWLGLLLGTLSARFRDIPSLVASVVQIAFFLTPILWKPDMRADLVYVVTLNPFYHLMEVVRAPLLGQSPELQTWLVACGMTATGWLASFLFYQKFRKRIAYWL
jgi:ABC-type polysaccharide/polyol phosphate export permease